LLAVKIEVTRKFSITGLVKNTTKSCISGNIIPFNPPMSPKRFRNV